MRKGKEVKDLTTIRITLEFPTEKLGFILSGCFEGGSNYWITSVKAKGNDMKGAEWLSDVPQLGGVLLITEDCNEEGCEVVVHELDKAKLLNGLVQYATKDGGLDWDAMDAGRYDRILQYALFNEQKYS